MSRELFLLFFHLAVNICDGFKILFLVPFPHTSHSILGEAFVNILLEGGHEVTYINPTPVEKPHQNLHQIIIERYTLKGTLKSFIQSTQTPKTSYGEIYEEMMNVTTSFLSDPNVQKLMEGTGQTFDLVIAERMLDDVSCGFSAVFHCPYIWFFTYENNHDMLRLMHESPNPALTTNMRTNNVPPLNFIQRVEELLFFIVSWARKIFYTDQIEATAYEKFFGPPVAKRGLTLPPFEVVRYNASLLFCNTHISLRDITEIPYSYKAIGGYHIKGAPEPLSLELSNIMEESRNGVILFSLGSYLKAEHLPSSVKRELLTMFSELNYTVLWKIDEQFENQPSNVKTFSWIPIQSVLAHPKCVLFITHGGMLSLTEGVHYGVPLIGIPFYGDQEANVKKLVQRGVVRMVTRDLMLADGLKKAIGDVLGDSKYKENMKRLSLVYHDRPLSPKQEILHWINHVILTQGAIHLRSPALLMPWYHKCFLDILFTIVVAIIVILFVVIRLIKYLKVKVKTYYAKNVKLLKIG